MRNETKGNARVSSRLAGVFAVWGLALLALVLMGCGSAASDEPAARSAVTETEAPVVQPTAVPPTAAPTDTPAPAPMEERPTTAPANAAPAATEVPPTEPPAVVEPTPEFPPEPTAAVEPTPEPSPEPPAGASGAVVTIGEGSQARYLIREQLARLPLPIDAVGETSVIEGSIVFDAEGVVLSGESRIAVNLASLVSDSDRRDGYVRSRTLNTEQYPDTVLVVRATPGLSWPLPAQGEVEFQIEGDMTVRDVTLPTTWDVTAVFEGNEVTGTAKTTVTFEDFDIPVPQVRIVLSVDPTIRLELDFEATIE